MAHEYVAYVVPHWERAAPDSVLGLALAAYSHAAFGRTRRVSKALWDADRLYASSVMKMHQEIREPSSDGVDQLIIATMLMGHVEVRTQFSILDFNLTASRILCTALIDETRPICRLLRKLTTSAHDSGKMCAITSAQLVFSDHNSS